jgi:glycosyltransferase involved in cell wall biosynthesis
MASQRFILVKQGAPKPAPLPGATVADLDLVRQWERDRSLIRHLFRYRDAEGLIYHLDLLSKPLTLACLLRLFSHGKAKITDQFGHRQPVSLTYLLRLMIAALRDHAQKRPLLQRIEREVDELLSPEGGPQTVTLHLAQRPVYLRTDLVFGLQSGGSVGHISGVLNHLDAYGGKPIFITTDRIPTVRPDVETHVVWPDHRFRDYPEIQRLGFNHHLFEQARRHLEGLPISLIYQRYGLNNFAGLRLARIVRVPFVLEYNGSEIWIHRHWGKPLAYEAIAEQIELANLRGAHLVVVVSQALKADLVARGIEDGKILVNPNGVDAKRYSPAVDGRAVRSRYGLADKTVIGFVGTFAPWHGAEILAAAFGHLLHACPAYRRHVHLLMIGDGVRMPHVKEILAKHGATSSTTLTGLVPQADGPTYLAACDVLVSPHVPNPDGSPFFGSPTKLFEYMAMGKGIVASRLEQIGEILRHDHSAWMVPPGDVEALKGGLQQLIEDQTLRLRLGRAARVEVVRQHTWEEHTRRVIDRLAERCR